MIIVTNALQVVATAIIKGFNISSRSSTTTLVGAREMSRRSY